METTLSIILIFMIAGAIYALHAKDLLSALVSFAVVGYSLVICFLLLKAPDLAIVQIVVETITLIFMVAVVMNSSPDELKKKSINMVEGKFQFVLNAIPVIILAAGLLYFFSQAIGGLNVFGEHTMRMATSYVDGASEKTGSANLVTGVLLNFRGYDTLGEATILITAVIGVLTILRSRIKTLI
jgi:multicomponent Na+:H+ antiporter subunit B